MQCVGYDGHDSRAAASRHISTARPRWLGGCVSLIAFVDPTARVRDSAYDLLAKARRRGSRFGVPVFSF